MAVKIENQYTGKLPRNTLVNIESALASVPREHLRGIERLRLVSVITEPRARLAAKGSDLPGLYHPRQGNQGAWFEVAITPLTSANKPFHKRIIPRLSFKGNLAAENLFTDERYESRARGGDGLVVCDDDPGQRISALPGPAGD